MKRILTLFAVCLVAVLGQGITDEQKAKLEAYAKFCIQETDVNPTLLAGLKRGEYADDEKLQCFATCVLKKIGMLNADGSINLDVARSKIPPGFPKDEAEHLIATCRDTTGNGCEKGFNLFKCIMQNKISLLN